MSVLLGLDGMSFRPLCRGLGWSKEQVKVYLVDIRKSIMDSSVQIISHTISPMGKNRWKVRKDENSAREYP
jgi:hypothetical protein